MNKKGLKNEGVKLTKRLIEAADTGERRAILWDSQVAGFGVRVTSKGRKVFVLDYRTRDGTHRRMNLGPYGVLTIEQARALARDGLAEVAQGGDPLGSRQAAREAPTMADLLERFDKEHVSTLKAKTAEDYRLTIKNHLLPRVGRIKVARFGLADAQALHNALRETPRMANLAIAVLSSALTFAERVEISPVQSNPCPAVRRFKEREVHRPMNELEITRLATVLRQAESADTSESAENPRAVAALWLLLFTGMRRNEVIRLRWDEVDIERGVLRLRDSKTGAKTIRINGPAKAVIEAQEPVLGNPYVFPSPVKPGAPLRDIKGVWERVRSLAGLGDVRLHDLRHTFAATAAASGLSLIQIAELLGHRDPRGTARYAHITENPARQASEQVGRALAKAIGDYSERIPPENPEKLLHVRVDRPSP